MRIAVVVGNPKPASRTAQRQLSDLIDDATQRLLGTARLMTRRQAAARLGSPQCRVGQSSRSIRRKRCP